MANNAVISISANIMTVQSMQGSIANFWWFSIGVQQWGKIKANSNKVEFVYPLQIDVLLSISLIREQDYNANSASAFLVRTHDNTKAILNLVTASTVAYAYVFLVAIQQWGYYESTRSEYDLIYPIAFVSATFCITAIGVEDGHGFAVIRSVSKTQARISNDTYTNYWIVIGMQCSGDIPKKTL